MATKITSYTVKAFSLFIILAVLFLLLTTAFAQGSEGIVLVKDVFLAVQDVEDLPDEVTFALYDSETAATPIATQTFQKGEYAVDYDFSKLDGFTFGSVARFEVNFTNTLNINDDSDTSVKIYEIWTEMEIDGTVAGNRDLVSNETLAALLWTSGAPISTYLALTYEGDEEAIIIIPGSSLGNYVSSLVDGYSSGTIPPSRALADPNNWYPSGNNIRYTHGNVGIGTTSPGSTLHIDSGSSLTNFTIESDTESSIHFMDAGGSPQGYKIGTGISGNTNNLEFYDVTDSRLIMTLNGEGSVGIGTTDPTGKLHVYGNVKAGMVVRIENANPEGSERFDLAGDGGHYHYLTRYNSNVSGHPNNTLVWKAYDGSNYNVNMALAENGNVGIGTTNPTYELSVNGTIRAKEIIVDTDWSDFVFEDNYRLPPLSEVEQFISENKHLPGIPTETEVKENGVTLGNISSKLLQKIEELTLYVIGLKTENESLKARLASIEKQLNDHRN